MAANVTTIGPCRCRIPPSLIRVAILGSGHLGHALGTLLGSRADIDTTIWGRSWARATVLNLTGFVRGEVAVVGRVRAEPDLVAAIEYAEVIIVTVPSYASASLACDLHDEAKACAVLLFWEGTGKSIRTLRADHLAIPLLAGLQRSPILSRIRERGASVDILGFAPASSPHCCRATTARLREQFFRALFRVSSGSPRVTTASRCLSAIR